MACPLFEGNVQRGQSLFTTFDGRNDTSMKVGKIPESVLKRSVFKQLRTKRPEVLVGAGVGEDCAVMKLQEDEVFVLSTDPITGTVKDIGELAVHITANDLASAGAEPVGILLTALLPESIEETDIRKIMEEAEGVCSRLNIQVMGGHTEVTRAVNQPLISVTGVGKVKADRIITTSGARPGQDVVLTKWIGMEGTSIIAKEKAAELANRFPAAFLDKAKSFGQMISVVEDGRVAARMGATAMHDVTEGGICGALWEMAEASGVGLDIDLKAIPIRQETVELCEACGLNPYYLISSGSMLIAIDNGYDLVRELEKNGIHGTVIGKATSGNDRVLVNGKDRAYLERPKADELYKIYT